MLQREGTGRFEQLRWAVSVPHPEAGRHRHPLQINKREREPYVNRNMDRDLCHYRGDRCLVRHQDQKCQPVVGR